MDEREMMAIAESILFISGDPVKAKDIGRVLNIDLRSAKKLMNKMIDCFNFERRGVQVLCINDSYQLATRPEYKEYIEEFVGTDKSQGLSQAALETLAIITYRQPITKADINELRGVKSDYIISRLFDMGYIKEVDRLDAPGRPIRYGTTDLFLKNFGFTSLNDLPCIEEIEQRD